MAAGRLGLMRQRVGEEEERWEGGWKAGMNLGTLDSKGSKTERQNAVTKQGKEVKKGIMEVDDLVEGAGQSR